MKIDDAHKRFYEASGQTSDRTRHLAFAGIAVVWILSGGGEHPTRARVSDDLVWPLFAFVGTLFFDFLQYVVQSAIWRLYSRSKEKGLQEKHGEENMGWREEEFTVPPELNWPGEVFFWAKVLALAAAYIPLLVHLSDRLR